MIDICLVQMPYAAIERPSPGLGLLKSSLAAKGFSVRVVYANLWFAEQIGLPLYQAVSIGGDPADLIGEWTFSGAAFPQFRTKPDAYLSKVLTGSYTAQSLQGFLGDIELQSRFKDLRTSAERFIAFAVEKIQALSPRIVGCSSMFQQHCASLALLRGIKDQHPGSVTLLGGANCEGPMGLMTHRKFDWIDYLVSGEAEQVLPKLCREILDNDTLVDLQHLGPGVLSPGNRIRKTPSLGRAGVDNLDTVPIPDYHEYFNAIQTSSLFDAIDPGIPIETSRGCWWGEKHPCSFCGLNGSGLRYRTKSPERVLDEFQTLTARYGIHKIQAVDNILSPVHIKKVLPHLNRQARPYSIFYETKSNLNRSQVEQLAQAGVRWIQPGIESMHSDILSALNKGNSPIINVRLLKWALQSGIRVSWNFLFGLPHERDEWYDDMASWLPLIVHLQPPSNMVRIRYDRFSPYHIRSGQFGLRLKPNDLYAHVYPLKPEDLDAIAFSFEDDTDRSREKFNPEAGHFNRPGLERLRSVVVSWHDLFWPKTAEERPPVLIASILNGSCTVLDTRPCAAELFTRLEGLDFLVYRHSENGTTLKRLVRNITSAASQHTTKAQVMDAARRLVDRRLMLNIDGQYLSLANTTAIPPLLKLAENPGGWVTLEDISTPDASTTKEPATVIEKEKQDTA